MGIEVFVHIRDHTESTTEKQSFEFSDEATLKDLRAEISQSWNVPVAFIYFFRDGDQILDSKLKLNDRDIIHVEHSFVKNMKAINANFSFLTRNLDLRDDLIEGMVSSIVDTVNQMKERRFFNFYPELEVEALAVAKKALSFLGGLTTTVQTAARLYFRDLHIKNGGLPENFRIEYGLKIGGVNCGLKCIINGSSEYCVKVHFGGPKKNSSNSTCPPNLKEIFGYILLYTLGFGPEVHFLPPPTESSKDIIYIATKSIPDFSEYRMDKICAATPNILTAFIEIHLLSTVFRFSDIHDENCGYVDNKLQVVDFLVPTKPDYTKFKTYSGRQRSLSEYFLKATPDPASPIYNGGIKNKKFEKIVAECNPEERRRVGRAKIQKLKMMECIENALKVTEEVKSMMKKFKIEIHSTDDFQQYIHDVKTNYNELEKVLFPSSELCDANVVSGGTLA